MSYNPHSPSPSCNSPSPSPSTPFHQLPDCGTSAGQPPRKRSRSEMSSEERKEARAHRNRIAAQNSRDRRKAQFSWLERRVNELEEENRRLRAGLPTAHVTPTGPSPILHIPLISTVPTSAPQIIPVMNPEDQLKAFLDKERERENEELKERIKTLERGWDAVVKALAAQGLPTGVPAASPSADATAPSPAATQPSQVSTPTQNTSSSPSTPTPATSTQTLASTTTSTQFSTGFPSPAPSHASIELEAIVTAPSSPIALPADHQPQIDDVTACHLARVATLEPSSMALQRAVSSSQAVKVPDDAKMEDLFREILVDDSAAATSTGTNATDSGRSVQATGLAVAQGTSASAEVGDSEKQGQGECLGKRKREEDEELSTRVTKKFAESNRLAFDGMDLNLGETAGLDFSFDWTNTISPITATPLTSDEMHQMLSQLDASNVDMMQFNDIGLDMGLSMPLSLDLGGWTNSTMASVY